MSDKPGSSRSGSGSGKHLGCIGKCTSGLSREELDRITDHVQWTLNSAQGRKIFRKYLNDARRGGDLACLELYEQCCQLIDDERLSRASEREPAEALERLITSANRLLELAESLDDVPEIDLALLERYTEALDSRSRPALLSVLEETKSRLQDHLRHAHKTFRAYVKQPCPRTNR